MRTTNIKKNFLYQCIYELLVIILPFITSPYIARTIGAENIGVFSYTYTIANYFVLFSCLGVKNYGNRTIAAVRDNQDELNRTFSSIFTLMFSISTVVFIIYLLCVNFFSEEYKIYAVIQAIYVFSCIFDINWFYFGIEKFKLTVTRNITIKVLTVICIFIFVKSEEDLWKYCLIMAIGTFFSQTIVCFFAKKYVKYIKPTWMEIKIHIKPIVVLFVPVLAVSFYKYMDKIMLGMISEKIQVGFYENAEKGINIPISIITAFGTVMLPKMSNLVGIGKGNEIRQYISTSMEYIMCLAIALGFGMASVAENFSVIFWGEEFRMSGQILKVLSISIPFMAFANVIRTQYLIPNKKDSSYIVSVFLGAIINVCMNLVLIPQYGALGAAVGTVFAEIGVCVVQAGSVLKELPIHSYLKNMIYFLINGLLMYKLVLQINGLVQNLLLNFIVQVSVGVIFYMGMTLIYFFMHKSKFLKRKG